MSSQFYKEKGFKTNSDFVRATLREIIIEDNIRDLSKIKNEVLSRCHMQRFSENAYRTYIEELLSKNTMPKFETNTKEIDGLTDTIIDACFYCLVGGYNSRENEEIKENLEKKETFTKDCLNGYCLSHNTTLNISPKIYDLCFVFTMLGLFQINEEFFKQFNVNDDFSVYDKNFFKVVMNVYTELYKYIQHYRPNEKTDDLDLDLSKLNIKSEEEKLIRFGEQNGEKTNDIVKFEKQRQQVAKLEEYAKMKTLFDKEFKQLENSVIPMFYNLSNKLYTKIKTDFLLKNTNWKNQDEETKDNDLTKIKEILDEEITEDVFLSVYFDDFYKQIHLMFEKNVEKYKEQK